MNWRHCSHLQDKREEPKELFQAKKNVFQSCGTEIAEGKSYKLHMDMDVIITSSSSSNEEDSNSGEEN